MADPSWITYVPYPFLLIVIAYLLANGDKVQIWGAMIARLGSAISSRLERASVARDIQGRIDEARSAPDLKELLPYRLKIKWENGDTVSELKEGQVIVVMSEHKSQARNFLNALMAYLSAGFLPYVRPYAPPAVSRGAELLVATKILAKERMDALLVFQKEIVEPELTNNSELAALKGTLESLDDAGLFTRVFLRELSMYGQKLAGSTPSKSDWMPIQKLIEMLTTLVTKTPGEDTERDFAVNTPQLSICVVLVGKAFTLLTRGTEPHVSYTNRKASSGIAQFYILARGENAKFGKEVVQKLIQTRSYEKDYEESFRTSARTQAQYIGALHIVKPSSEGP